MRQISILDPSKQRQVLRATSTKSRARTTDSARWAGNDAFLIKPTLEEGEDNWLGFEWAKKELVKRDDGKDKYSTYPTV